MINKQNLWFITLFSLIVILCIYYVSLPEKSLVSMVSNTNNLSDVIEITESDMIVALKVEEEEKLLNNIETAQEKLLNEKSTLEEKNDAYLTLQRINNQKGQMQKIEKLLKDKFNVTSCVKIENNSINITVSSKDQGIDTANKMINEVQSLYNEQKYITIKFQN